MKILAADFVISAAGAGDGIPRDGLLQVALAGRSNVGKSSLINALTRRRIARTSAAPGKTRLANVYRVELEGVTAAGRLALYLVDLPGYGYARGGAESAAELAGVAEAYFADRLRPEPGAKPPSESERGCRLRQGSGEPRRSTAEAGGPASAETSGRSARVSQATAALLLVDARHPGLDSDVQAARWLASRGVAMRVVATKIDKLTRSERARNLEAIGNTFGTAALPVSAASGEGLDALWRMIARIARDEDRDA